MRKSALKELKWLDLGAEKTSYLLILFDLDSKMVLYLHGLGYPKATVDS